MVAPFTGAWIEILGETVLLSRRQSLPSRERGLKLLFPPVPVLTVGSLPSRERGLKFTLNDDPLLVEHVAPFTGAWIEIFGGPVADCGDVVAPFTGAWIEIGPSRCWPEGPWSLPSRERGLKWSAAVPAARPAGRSLHGSVD